MKAMILAAGLGTRLKPLTDTRPKALVELSGRTLLEITITRLASFGVTDFIVNVHHFADQVAAYLKSHNNFGLHIELSREDDLLLDTGGGLKKASWFFLEDARHWFTPSFQGSLATRHSLPEPFLLHNVDVISNIDLRAMLQFHNDHQALATLAVQSRPSSRLLLFDDHLQLTARVAPNSPLTTRRSSTPSEAEGPLPLAFSGIHILSPRILPLLTETAVFSIIGSYLRLASEGHKILAFRADQYYWRDLGRPADLAQAALDLQQNVSL
jgi:NDP-sugar pyrophosphorylase family protein